MHHSIAFLNNNMKVDSLRRKNYNSWNVKFNDCDYINFDNEDEREIFIFYNYYNKTNNFNGLWNDI